MNKKEKEMDKRNRLMAATEEVFSRRGYAQATVDEIITRADTGKGTLCKYFGNKENLFYTLVSQKHGALMERMWPIANDAAKSVEDRLIGLLAAWIGFLRENIVLWQVLFFEMTCSNRGYWAVETAAYGLQLKARWGELPPAEEQENILRYHRLLLEEIQPITKVYRDGMEQDFFNAIASHEDIAKHIFLAVSMLVFFHTANELEKISAEELASNIIKTRLYGLARRESSNDQVS